MSIITKLLQLGKISILLVVCSIANAATNFCFTVITHDGQLLDVALEVHRYTNPTNNETIYTIYQCIEGDTTNFCVWYNAAGTIRTNNAVKIIEDNIIQ